MLGLLSGNRAIKWSNTGSVGKHKFTKPLTAFLFLVPTLIRANCPDLSTFYSLVEDTPRLVRDELLALTNDCEQSSQFFALLGSAQLAVGDLLQAGENLELALLLEPDNGSAMVDYAEVLFELGQVSSAVRHQQLLLEPSDLPENWLLETTLLSTAKEVVSEHDFPI